MVVCFSFLFRASFQIFFSIGGEIYLRGRKLLLLQFWTTHKEIWFVIIKKGENVISSLNSTLVLMKDKQASFYKRQTSTMARRKRSGISLKHHSLKASRIMANKQVYQFSFELNWLEMLKNDIHTCHNTSLKV